MNSLHINQLYNWPMFKFNINVIFKGSTLTFIWVCPNEFLVPSHNAHSHIPTPCIHLAAVRRHEPDLERDVQLQEVQLSQERTR